MLMYYKYNVENALKRIPGAELINPSASKNEADSSNNPILIFSLINLFFETFTPHKLYLRTDTKPVLSFH